MKDKTTTGLVALTITGGMLLVGSLTLWAVASREDAPVRLAAAKAGRALVREAPTQAIPKPVAGPVTASAGAPKVPTRESRREHPVAAPAQAVATARPIVAPVTPASAETPVAANNRRPTLSEVDRPGYRLSKILGSDPPANLRQENHVGNKSPWPECAIVRKWAEQLPDAKIVMWRARLAYTESYGPMKSTICSVWVRMRSKMPPDESEPYPKPGSNLFKERSWRFDIQDGRVYQCCYE